MKEARSRVLRWCCWMTAEVAGMGIRQTWSSSSRHTCKR